MQYQIKKWFNNNWYDIDIENIRKDDVITVWKEDGTILPNANGETISKVIKDAWLEDDIWKIESIPYLFKKYNN